MIVFWIGMDRTTFSAFSIGWYYGLWHARVLVHWNMFKPQSAHNSRPPKIILNKKINYKKIAIHIKYTKIINSNKYEFGERPLQLSNFNLQIKT